MNVLLNHDDIAAMKTIIHKAATRGHANHGWLNSYHTFSFANYYNPERIQFGVLRVLNDDTVAPGTGFGKHPHENMEIISIPLSGDLEHGDSLGNHGIISQGDIQVMSAGKGIIHSEKNKNRDKEVKFLQIWIIPNKLQVEPRYDQISLKDIARENALYQVLSPNAEEQGVWIHQDAWFFMGDFTQPFSGRYELKNKLNGVYCFVIEGRATVAGVELAKRDGLGIWETHAMDITAEAGSRVLLMEIPMNY